MRYCPHCSETLPKPVKICPHCKRSIDLHLLTSMYEPGDGSSEVNKKIRRKIWFREKLVIILPVIALAIGFTAGLIVMFSYSQIQFASTRSDYENQISALQKAIEQQDQKAVNSQLELNQRLQEREIIIASLSEQNQILSRIIAFTNRLSRNSTITPNNPQDIDYFQRNIRYLQSLFAQEQEKLGETSYSTEATFNLVPIPQFLE